MEAVAKTTFEEEFITNSRGLKLFTCRWLPASGDPKALIFICHGYAMECSITMNSTGIRLAEAGYSVYGVDYEGHGKSAGIQGYVESFDDVVDDCCDYFERVCERKENAGKMRYMLSESMGGAISLLVHRKMTNFWDGAVLVAPMCKIAEDMKPSPAVITVLTKLIKIIPTWKIIPTKDIIDLAFKQPEIREQVKTNAYCYKGRPRLKTGYELMRVSMDLEKTLEQVSLPFVVPGMWHGLLYGETPENIDVVFGDIVGWLDKKTGEGNSRLEREWKMVQDDLHDKTK